MKLGWAATGRNRVEEASVSFGRWHGVVECQVNSGSYSGNDVYILWDL